MGLAEKVAKEIYRIFQFGNEDIDFIASIVEVEAGTSAGGNIQKAM